MKNKLSFSVDLYVEGSKLMLLVVIFKELMIDILVDGRCGARY